MTALITCLFLQTVYIRAIIGNTCIRKFTRQPLNGYHCNIEYYTNVTNLRRHRCTSLCIKDPQCWVLSYNHESSYCLMGSEPCTSAEVHPHFSLMVFREKEDETCVSWIPPLNDSAIPARLVETRPHLNPNHHAALGRMTIGQNIYLGTVLTPWAVRSGYFPIDGNEVVEPTNYELLLVSPNCSIAWVPYTTGDMVPAAALKLGYVTGKGPTYSIRVYAADVNADKFGVYATGDSVAYYPHFGTPSATEVLILTRV